MQDAERKGMIVEQVNEECKGLAFTLDAVEREVYDVAGIRVIRSFLDDI